MAASRNPTRITAEPDKQDLFITREFDAPRDLVFRAYTDPAVYVEWIGPRGYTTTIDVFEPVSGGKWRWIQSDPEGHAFAFRGVYHEVTAPERIIGTFEFNGWSFQDGSYTDPAFSQPVSSSGNSYLTLGPGLRTSICDKIDFGFGYSFRQRQHLDPRNLPPIPRGIVGPLLALPGNAGGTGFPPSAGVEDALDWYNSFDADFTYNPAIPGYETDPNRTLSRGNFVNTFYFGGDPYASYYTRLFGSILGCPGDFNGDGFIDFFDYDDYVNCFENNVCPSGRTADINRDQFVDFFDYDAFVEAFEVGC